MPVPDSELIERSRSGDSQAYGRLVERYQNLVRAVAASATGDLAASEELAQEAFITAWTRLDDLREPGRFSSWVCGIARNHARYRRRHDHRHAPMGSESVERMEQLPAQQRSPLDEVIERQEWDLMHTALADVPVSYREPLVLFYGLDRSIAEVARHLGVSRDTAKQRLHRGRKHLQHGVRTLLRKELTRPLGTAAIVVMAIAGSRAAQAGTGVGINQASTPLSSGGAPASKAGLSLVGSAKVAGLVAVGAALALYLIPAQEPDRPASPAQGPIVEPTATLQLAVPPAPVSAPNTKPDTTVAPSPERSATKPTSSSMTPLEVRTRPQRSLDRPTVTERGPESVREFPAVEPAHETAPPAGPDRAVLRQAIQTSDQRAPRRPRSMPIVPPDFADRIADIDI